MIDTNTIINTCQIASMASPSIRVVAEYSHIIPVVLSIILGVFVFFKTRFNFFSKVFLSFVIVFSLWLISDVIAWTSNDYHLVYTTWSFLDYLEIVFYILGFYFATVFVKKSDISKLWKVILFALTLPALWLTVSQQSVTGFNYPVCEAFNNNFLGQYKLVVESLILVIILIYPFIPFFKKLARRQKVTDLVVLGSMFLFLSVFGVTEYLASVTGYYEMNLYSLFLLPIFLVAIIYSVFELDIFKVDVLGTHYLVVGFVVLMGGQLFFIENNANRLLIVIAMFMAVALSVILFRNLKRESDQRVHIVKLNVQLENLLKQRESLVHLVTHKVKGSFTRSKYIFAGLLDGTFGEVSAQVKKYAKTGLESDNAGIQTVDLVLNASNLSTGTVKYDMKVIDLKELVKKTLEEKKVQAEAKGLKLKSAIAEGYNYNVLGDVFWLREAINNLVDNSIKYTKEGEISVQLTDGDGKIKFSIKDTGIGITDEDKKLLFTEGGRGKDSVRINVDSTGYGLYSTKLILAAHKGRIWAESDGAGKGSAFYIELPSCLEGGAGKN